MKLITIGPSIMKRHHAFAWDQRGSRWIKKRLAKPALEFLPPRKHSTEEVKWIQDYVKLLAESIRLKNETNTSLSKNWTDEEVDRFVRWHTDTLHQKGYHQFMDKAIEVSRGTYDRVDTLFEDAMAQARAYKRGSVPLPDLQNAIQVWFLSAEKKIDEFKEKNLI